MSIPYHTITQHNKPTTRRIHVKCHSLYVLLLLEKIYFFNLFTRNSFIISSTYLHAYI